MIFENGVNYTVNNSIYFGNFTILIIVNLYINFRMNDFNNFIGKMPF